MAINGIVTGCEPSSLAALDAARVAGRADRRSGLVAALPLAGRDFLHCDGGQISIQ